MTRMYLKRTLRGFEPADLPSFDLMRKYKTGDVYKADVTKPRNYESHKLCMALLRLTFDNQDRWTDFTKFRKAIAFAAGHTEEIVKVDGEIMNIPGSLSFDALDEIEFNKVFGAMMSICADLLGLTRPDLQAEVDRYAGELAA